MSTLARTLLEACLTGAPPEELLSELTSEALTEDPARSLSASNAFFGTFVEGLSDAFEPRLSAIYAKLFSRVAATALEELDEDALWQRYQRVSRPRGPDAIPKDVRDVFVLSRITLGADVAVTSTVLDALKRRFPRARIVFVGPEKNWALFSGDPKLEHVLVEYPKQAALRERLSIARVLQSVLARPSAIVVDPDSRLTQLGVLPVCAEERYFFFDSRAYGGESDDSLYVLVRRWLSETFGVDGRPYIRPAGTAAPEEGRYGAVSLGVGGNQEKRIDDPFEVEFLKVLSGMRGSVLVDVGGGGEETERVEAAVSAAAGPAHDVRTWTGSFADFATVIRESGWYAGYDSAGQHVAAVCGIPALTVFAGYPSERMFHRWRPVGDGPREVVRVEDRDPESVLGKIAPAFRRLNG